MGKRPIKTSKYSQRNNAIKRSERMIEEIKPYEERKKE